MPNFEDLDKWIGNLNTTYNLTYFGSLALATISISLRFIKSENTLKPLPNAIQKILSFFPFSQIVFIFSNDVQDHMCARVVILTLKGLFLISIVYQTVAFRRSGQSRTKSNRLHINNSLISDWDQKYGLNLLHKSGRNC